MDKKEVGRISQIAGVLLKNGLGFLVDELNLTLHLPFTKRFLMNRKKKDDLAYRLRISMEELGGAFIKFGQLLSLRPDLIPYEYCREFKKLLDDVPPVDFKLIKKEIEKGLGEKDLDSVFRHIDPVPLGSASVAQVHKAKLKSGKDVVIKVLRPNIKNIFDSDIKVMRFIAQKIENNFSDLPVIPTKIVEEFEHYTRNELNLVFEARNIERINKQKHSVKIIIPQVYWFAVSKNILTISFIDGKKLSHVKHPDRIFSSYIVDELLKELFDYGFFHADLHPGNLIITNDNKLGLIDFGIVGSVNTDLRMLAFLLYKSINNKDSEGVLEALLKYGSASKKTDLNEFKEDIDDILNEWYDEEGKSNPTHMMHQLFISCTKHGFVVPKNAVLFAKALITAEGTCKYIDPNFDFVSYAQAKSAKILSKFSSPKAIKKYIIDESKKFVNITKSIPEESLSILQKINSGRFEFSLDDSRFRRIGFNISSSSNRLAYALIITALIISSALLIDIGPFIGGYPVLSIIGLIFAGLLMIPLFLSILHEPKRVI